MRGNECLKDSVQMHGRDEDWNESVMSNRDPSRMPLIYDTAQAQVKKLENMGVTHKFHEFYVAKAPPRHRGKEGFKEVETVYQESRTVTEVMITTVTEVRRVRVEPQVDLLGDLSGIDWQAGNAGNADLAEALVPVGPGNATPCPEPLLAPEAEPGNPVTGSPVKFDLSVSDDHEDLIDWECVGQEMTMLEEVGKTTMVEDMGNMADADPWSKVH